MKGQCAILILTFCEGCHTWRRRRRMSGTRECVFLHDHYPEPLGHVFQCVFFFLSHIPGSNIITRSSGQKYDLQLFEPRRRIERPGGVGDIGDMVNNVVGLRICPGQHLAAQLLFLVIANLCYSFDIKAKERKEDTLAYTTGFNVSAS